VTKNNLFLQQLRDFPNFHLIAGIDEAGRGPLAGPLVVSAVILNPGVHHDFLNDSKRVKPQKRRELYDWIHENALEIVVEVVSVEEIERLNILGATLLGMRTAVNSLKNKPNIALVDGNKLPDGLDVFAQAIVSGDSKYASIAAASIIAKEKRDGIMIELDKQYPEYGFAIHKGYPTKQHIAMLEKLGILSIHRKSYRPIKTMLENNKSI
jgi:ribonuclease HII